MFTRDVDNIVMLYESMNKFSFLVEYDGEGNRIHSLPLPNETGEALREPSSVYGNLMFQKFSKENDPNFPDITNRRFGIQVYDKNEVEYLKDEENGDVWMNNPADLKEILHRIVTFGFDYEYLKEYFPKLTENDYSWLQSLS